MDDKKPKTTDHGDTAHGLSPDTPEHAEHGIPPEAHDAEPTGLPNSDRHHGEVAATKP